MTAAEGYGKGSIITPEAVVLDFELAGLASRAIAYGIDFGLQFVALLIFISVTSAFAIASELAAIIVLLVGLILIVLGYSVVMETFKGGRTFGRMVVKTRVVTVEGAPIRFRHALIRSLLGIVDLLISVGSVAVVSSLVTKRGQRLGDLVAGTMVIREPSVTATSGAMYFWPPAYLVEWSRTVDTRSLGNDTYQIVRDFLSNTDLADVPRLLLAEEIAALVSERLPHAACTPQVPALDYLMAIAAATQEPGSHPQPPPPAASSLRRSAIQPPPPVAAAPSEPVPGVDSLTPAPAPAAPNDGGFAAPS